MNEYVILSYCDHLGLYFLDIINLYIHDFNTKINAAIDPTTIECVSSIEIDSIKFQ